MTDVFAGIKRTVKHFGDDFITVDDGVERTWGGSTYELKAAGDAQG